MIPLWLQAALWGLLGGSALVLGALIAFAVDLPQRVIALVMAIGSGVLISVVSFDLMDEAYSKGGFLSAAVGFLVGAGIYTAANVYISRRGASHRKRSGSNGAESQGETASSGIAIAVGALLDGIPESIVIGVGLLEGGSVSLVTVAAIFLSNVPEGLSSAAGMRKAGRPAGYIFGVWGGIAFASGAAALIGNVVLAGAPPEVIAAVTAIAAGAILAMLVDTMIPEAFDSTHEYAGLVTLDFVSDQLTDQRRFRILAIVDDYTRECLALVADTSLSGIRVDRKLDRLVADRSRPRMIVSDNGSEFTSNAIVAWADQNRIEWHYIGNYDRSARCPSGAACPHPCPRGGMAGGGTARNASQKCFPGAACRRVASRATARRNCPAASGDQAAGRPDRH